MKISNSVVAYDVDLANYRVALRFVTVAWAVLVFYLSTERFGSDFSQGLVVQVLAWLQISLSPRSLHVLDVLLRKTAHIIEYGTLTFFIYGSFGDQQPFRWRLDPAMWCIGIVGFYSITDELHQMFVPGRHASLVDCAIDVAGATIAIFMIFMARPVFGRVSRGMNSVV